MMQKEKHDPEKTNLLNDTHVDRKRRHYSGSRSKSGHKTTSSSERPKQNQPYKMDKQELRNTEFDACRSQSLPFQSEKRDSWWFWGDTDVKSKAEDTCSCVSCALKKLISTDYACIVCIILLLVVSVIVAVMLVYNSVPCMTSANERFAKESNKNTNHKTENDRLKRRIGGLGGKWNFGAKDSWTNPFTRGQDRAFGSFKFQDMSSLVDTDSDLSRILDADKMTDIQNSERLRDFYRKLIETDAAIRNLRKTLSDSLFPNTNSYDIDNNYLKTKGDFGSKSDVMNLNIYPDRIKRSLKLFHRPMKMFHFKRNEHTTKSKIDNGKLVTKTTVHMATSKKPHKSSRNKRNDNFSDNEGFMIEKNKVVIQYKPSHVVPKCSHAPKDSKSHETQMNHPFYKNTQRLDELLDQFIDKKLPDLFSDRFEINTLLKNKKYKYPANDEVVFVKDEKNQKQEQVNNDDQTVTLKQFKKVAIEAPETESKQIVKTETNAFENEFLNDEIDKKTERSSTSSYDILLSISTLINPVLTRTPSYPSPILDKLPSLRKLMQVNAKDEEGVAYQDIKEVLADYKEGHDDHDKASDRKKRNNVKQENMPAPNTKNNILGVHNQNWKGPMPLYPEELIQVMKQSKNPAHSASETEDAQPKLTDIEYVEDYLDNGYEKLVQLAQAYSDYGVLDEKKETDTERKTEEKSQHKLGDRKVRLGSFKRGFKKSSIFGRHTKGGSDNSEGIRIELQPTTQSREDNLLNFKEMFNKHIKISSDDHPKIQNKISLATPALVHVHDFHLPYTPKLNSEKGKTSKNYEPANVVYKKRTLKVINTKNDTDEDAVFKTNENFSNFESVTSKIYKRDTDNAMKNESNETKTIDNKTIYGKTKKRNAENYEKVKETVSDNNNMTMSDFFMLLSNWFSSLDGLEITTRKTTDFKTITPREQILVVEKHNNDSGRSEMIFPLYDSDMIENIGHRSRVLLSVDVINNTKNADDHFKPEDDEEQNLDVSSATEPMNNMNSTDAVYEITELVTNKYTNENTTNNRKVKRQAIDDSNLIFWNDLYDDEYGIKADPMENNIRDKHSIDKNDFIKKSNEWFQDKVRQISHKLSLSNSREKGGSKAERMKHAKRNAVYTADDEGRNNNNGKIDFAALTEKMKEVCKKTVRAVEEAKHVQVREDKKEGQVATSTLMQQLVRLMTDLVDFQVQERTCRTLPPDLQQFLEWLTSSKDDEAQSDVESYFTDKKDREYPSVNFDKSTEQDLLQPSERENPDSKTDCLGTLQAVQALIRQYDDMSDDDKSVMTGVKDYLENQMNFLQKQLYSVDESKMYNQDAPRFRRTVTDSIEDEYNNLRHMYRNYMKKLKKGSKKVENFLKKSSNRVSKITVSVKEAVTEIGKQIGKITKIPKYKNRKFFTEKEKISKEYTAAHKGSKDKEHLKDKFYTKDKSHVKDNTHLKDNNHLKDNKARLKDKNHMKSKDHIQNKHIFDESGKKYDDHVITSEKYGRNIEDVYFKTVEEVKKASTVKSGVKRGSDLFDKTEILRIDEELKK